MLPKHGGYRKLKSFQLAQLVYDVTVRFCETYISKRSRTHDKMVQAARSGVQNIAEGSQASGTSKKTELKLTNVVRASLEGLKLDYEDFLRQRNLPLWNKDDPRRNALVKERCSSAEQVALWVRKVHDGQNGLNGQHGRNGHSDHKPVDRSGHSGLSQDSHTWQSIPSIESISSISSIPQPPPNPAAPPREPYSSIAANAALVLIGVTNALLDRQIKFQADTFQTEGGFTERLYKTRQSHRRT